MADKFVPLSTLANIIGGYAFKSDKFKSTGVPVVKIANISPPRVDLQSCDCVNEEDTVGLDRFKVSAGDIVMAMTGATIGKVGRYRESSNAYLNQRVAKITAKNGVADNNFISALLSQSTFEGEVLAQSSGSAQANVSTDGIGRIMVPFFPIGEQKRIGEIISTLDDKIELNRRQNQTLESLVRALFQSWFVEFEPVLAKADGEDEVGICKRLGLSPQILALFPASLEDSALGEIPVGWHIRDLETISHNIRRQVQPNRNDKIMPYIGLEHMPRKSIALSDWETDVVPESGKYVFQRNDILFGKLRPYFHKVGIAPIDGICSTDILVLKPKNQIWYNYLLNVLSSDVFIASTNASSTGTKMPCTSWPEMKHFKLALPTEEVAQAFNGITTPFIQRIIANVFESHALSVLRNELLPRFLLGEIHV